MKRASVLAVACCAAVASLAVPARAQLRCASDKDCEGDLVCEDGTCAKPASSAAPAASTAAPTAAPTTAATAAPAAPPTNAPPAAPISESAAAGAPAGGSCATDRDCAGDLVCSQTVCIALAPRPPKRPKRHQLDLGVALGTSPGFTGQLANSAGGGVTVGPEVVLALGPINWHLRALYESLNGYGGTRLEPLDFGVPIALGALIPGADAQFDVEPMIGNAVEYFSAQDANVNGTTVTTGQSFFMVSSYVAPRVRAKFRSFYAAIVPVGLEARYLNWYTAGHDLRASIGFNWMLSISGGFAL